MFLSTLLTFVVFVIVFGLLVFVHEMGHFLAARLTGTGVGEFSIGLGPEIWSKQGEKTKWTLRAIPFGGYCSIEGQEESSKSKTSYTKKSYWQKMFILSGGVIMNFLLAVVLYYFLIGGLSGFQAAFPKIGDIDFIFGRQETFATTGTAFTEVMEDSPAYEAGIDPYGEILRVNDQRIYTTDELIDLLVGNTGKEVDLEISYATDGIETETKYYSVIPNKSGQIGVQLQMEDAYVVYYEGLSKPFVGFAHSINLLQFQVKALGSLIGESVSTRDITPVAENVSGPVGIFAGVDIFLTVGGFVGVLNLLGLLSLALAFFNILPFPALDGGHMTILNV